MARILTISYESDFLAPGESAVSDFLVAIFVLAIVVGLGTTVWKVSTARRMAERAGMNPDDAATVTLVSEGGFEATYLAANLRPQPAATVPTPSVAARLTELRELLDQGLITQAEHDERRRAIIDSV